MAVINIIDPCMITNAGHHADINTRLARELIRRGHKPVIYANKKYESKLADIDVRPVLSHNAYDIVPRMAEQTANNSPVNVFHGASAIFEGELSRIKPGALTVFPSIFAYQLYAISSPRLSMGAVIGGLHNQPNYNNPNGDVFWKMALIRAGSKSSSLKLGVFESELLLEYERILPSNALEIAVFPIPYDGADPAKRSDRLEMVGLLGHQRVEKGLGNIFDVVNKCLALGLHVTLQDSSEKLQKLMTPNARVNIFGYVESMGSLIAQCDVTLLDYSSEIYRFSGSGIAWESLASGVPVLAPKGTSMSSMLRAYDTGATFCAADPNFKFKALEAMRLDYKSHAARAHAAQQRFKEKNGIKRFVDLVTKGLQA